MTKKRSSEEVPRVVLLTPDGERHDLTAADARRESILWRRRSSATPKGQSDVQVRYRRHEWVPGMVYLFLEDSTSLRQAPEEFHD